ncbi:hypothetical protein PCL_02455 [Purpureocillium lilacinum]|uniref:Mitochondrial F1F0 ATP synthase subunit Atp18 n=1 Tax=Purpureocillium lilacinum TaxID=33203 RepID=A0A2U3E0P2_PURLI|nr:hypothetical protein PCL_02455 [Purpureocillium lilacinum]
MPRRRFEDAARDGNKEKASDRAEYVSKRAALQQAGQRGSCKPRRRTNVIGRVARHRGVERANRQERRATGGAGATRGGAATWEVVRRRSSGVELEGSLDGLLVVGGQAEADCTVLVLLWPAAEEEEAAEGGEGGEGAGRELAGEATASAVAGLHCVLLSGEAAPQAHDVTPRGRAAAGAAAALNGDSHVMCAAPSGLMTHPFPHPIFRGRPGKSLLPPPVLVLAASGCRPPALARLLAGWLETSGSELCLVKKARFEDFVPATSTPRHINPIATRAIPTNSPIMSWLGVAPFKKFPAPFRACSPGPRDAVPPPEPTRQRPRWLTIATVKPMAPFFAAGLIIAYGANSAQNAMMASDEWKNDPRNPNAKTAGTGGH